MFETLRGHLRSKIETSTISLKIEEKLQAFLTDNPDVDHYISDNNRKMNRANFWLGIVLGAMIIAFIAVFIFLVQLMIWHQLGYVNIPGWTT